METVLLAREADAQSLIKDRPFENALILGPALIAPLNDIELHNCIWEGPSDDPEVLLIEVPPGRPLVGVIGLDGVKFTNCTFRNIGIIGTAETLAFMRAGISGRDVQVKEGKLT